MTTNDDERPKIQRHLRNAFALTAATLLTGRESTGVMSPGSQGGDDQAVQVDGADAFGREQFVRVTIPSELLEQEATYPKFKSYNRLPTLTLSYYDYPEEGKSGNLTLKSLLIKSEPKRKLNTCTIDFQCGDEHFGAFDIYAGKKTINAPQGGSLLDAVLGKIKQWHIHTKAAQSIQKTLDEINRGKNNSQYESQRDYFCDQALKHLVNSQQAEDYAIRGEELKRGRTETQDEIVNIEDEVKKLQNLQTYYEGLSNRTLTADEKKEGVAAVKKFIEEKIREYEQEKKRGINGQHDNNCAKLITLLTSFSNDLSEGNITKFTDALKDAAVKSAVARDDFYSEYIRVLEVVNRIATDLIYAEIKTKNPDAAETFLNGEKLAVANNIDRLNRDFLANPDYLQDALSRKANDAREQAGFASQYIRESIDRLTTMLPEGAAELTKQLAEHRSEAAAARSAANKIIDSTTARTGAAKIKAGEETDGNQRIAVKYKPFDPNARRELTIDIATSLGQRYLEGPER